MESKIEINGTANQTLPPGKYTLIGVDVDTTGRRLIDEIVHLAAYTPNAQFGQHIMPVMNLNPAATQRHQIRVITIGFFRMLKNMQSYKFIKTKTEIAALRDFLDWLEERKKADVDSNGIVLLYHEKWKFISYMILEAMKKYDLLDRFLNIVQYFANGYALAEEKCANTVKYYSLRQLSKVLLNQEYHDSNNIAKNNGSNNIDNENNNSSNNNDTNNDSNNNTSNSSNSTNSNNNRSQFEGSATVRAQLAYEIVQHLAKGERESLNGINSDEMINMIRPYTNLTSIDINELQDQNKCLDRQNSLRAIFVNYFKTSKYHRVRAVTFRRVLAENGYDLTTLQEIWCSTKKDGLKEVVSTMETLKTEEKNELADLLDCHFDPDKENVKPIFKKQKRRMPRRGQRENGVNKGRNGHNNNVDSTVKSPVKKENDKLQQTSPSTKEIIEKKEHQQEPELNKTEVAAVVAVN